MGHVHVFQTYLVKEPLLKFEETSGLRSTQPWKRVVYSRLRGSGLACLAWYHRLGFPSLSVYPHPSASCL